MLFLVISTKAEYRVYQMAVKATNPFSLDQKTHVITTTLNPRAYVAYHGGSLTLQVDLLRTWMCLGNTANKNLCGPPITGGEVNEAVN